MNNPHLKYVLLRTECVLGQCFITTWITDFEMRRKPGVDLVALPEFSREYRRNVQVFLWTAVISTEHCR